MRSWRSGRPAWLVAAALVLATAPSLDAAAAEPGAAQRARAEATAAAAEVDALAGRLAAQVAAEEVALRAVSTGVQASLAAEDAAGAAAASAASARARQARTVRALYSTGGELAVYASVLGAASLEDVAGRQQMAARVLQRAASTSRDAAVSAALAGNRAQAADEQAGAQVAAAADVAAAGAAVEQTLSRARARLDALSRDAARLTAAEEARARWLAAERAASAARGRAAASAGHQVAAVGVPADYLALYQRAARGCPGLRWTLLAAVGQVESRHGRNNGPSSAGAVGPMQFMPRTFAAYGVDGDGDGTADPWSPADAVVSAARYLCHHGAGGGTADTDRRALLRYNNAQWYVDLVLGVERDLVAGLALTTS